MSSIWSSLSSRNCRIAVALSGGVDSSVAALLLKEKFGDRHKLLALHMSNWDHQDDDDFLHRVPKSNSSCWEQDWKDAKAVAQHLQLGDMHHVSFVSEYWTMVFEPFVEALMEGRMGNPDIGCNRFIKFGALLSYCRETLNADYLATGHYARLWHREDSDETPPPLHLEQDWLWDWGRSDSSTTPLLLAAKDRSKDQSYFLAGVPGRAFKNVLFPLGDLHKNHPNNSPATVRQLARQAKLPTATKPDSMGICFVGKRRSFKDFMVQYLPGSQRGATFLDVDTRRVVGTSPYSTMQYTIGQGAKIGGASQKWFVVDKDHSNIWVCGGTHHPALYAETLFVEDISWVAQQVPPPLERGGQLLANCRIRHLQKLIPCVVEQHSQTQWLVTFDRPVRGITEGQMAVFYVGEVCLGGGPISSRGPTYHDLGLELPSTVFEAPNQRRQVGE